MNSAVLINPEISSISDEMHASADSDDADISASFNSPEMKGEHDGLFCALGAAQELCLAP